MTTTGRIEGLAHLQFRAHLDSRGALVRVFDDAVMAASHVDFVPNYALASVNPTVGTLRGMHFQRGSAGESRLMTCVSGAIHNISVDLRQSSATYLTVEVNVLRASDGHSILVPPGCANGWMTLESNTVLCYQISGGYSPDASTGIRFDDPSFPLHWPMTPTVISDADRNWPDFEVNRVGAPE
jgi:dTDP-4-dehydrorhamnose 3,5-epimerase